MCHTRHLVQCSQSLILSRTQAWLSRLLWPWLSNQVLISFFPDTCTFDCCQPITTPQSFPVPHLCSLNCSSITPSVFQAISFQPWSSSSPPLVWRYSTQKRNGINNNDHIIWWWNLCVTMHYVAATKTYIKIQNPTTVYLSKWQCSLSKAAELGFMVKACWVL